jgi:hypothetical protein
MSASVGLCARCAFARLTTSARGSRFWRCLRADSDPAYPRYPSLPVLRCPGFEQRGTLGPEEPADPPRDPAAGEGRGGR